MKPTRSNPELDMARQAKAWVIALNIVYGTVAFGLIGFAIDYFTGTKPWAMVVGIALGLIVGTYRFIREAMAMNAATSGGPTGTGRQEPGRSDGKKTP